MTRETKIGLLVGLAFIIVIGILLSDHLTSATEPQQAQLAQVADSVRTGVAVPGAATANPPITAVTPPANVAPQAQVPTKEEITPKQPAVEIVQIGGAPAAPASPQQPQSPSQPVAIGPAAPQAPATPAPTKPEPPITLVPPTDQPAPEKPAAPATPMPTNSSLAQVARTFNEELVSIDGGGPRAVTPEGVFGRLAILPDGGHFVTRGLDRRLAVFALEGETPRPVTGAEGRDLPIVVSADGEWLYVQGGRNLPGDLSRVHLRTGRREAVRSLLPPDPAGTMEILRTVMTPDARAYAYTFVRALSALYIVDGLR